MKKKTRHRNRDTKQACLRALEYLLADSVEYAAQAEPHRALGARHVFRDGACRQGNSVRVLEIVDDVDLFAELVLF